MTIWQKITDAVDGGAGAVGGVLGWAGGFLGIADTAQRRQVAFSVAMIALSAKMAKADGVVTGEEVAAFRGLFRMEAGEAGNVARLFDLAKRDVAGFESYAARIAGIYSGDRQGLEDVIDGLFAIARADGAVHEAELRYLKVVAEIFGIDAHGFERIAARHVIPEEGDPYIILGVSRTLDVRSDPAPLPEARRRKPSRPPRRAGAPAGMHGDRNRAHGGDQPCLQSDRAGATRLRCLGPVDAQE